jgi:hypothetical protein
MGKTKVALNPASDGHLTKANTIGTLGRNQKTFETIGVEFIDENGGRAGVRCERAAVDVDPLKTDVCWQRMPRAPRSERQATPFIPPSLPRLWQSRLTSTQRITDALKVWAVPLHSVRPLVSPSRPVSPVTRFVAAPPAGVRGYFEQSSVLGSTLADREPSCLPAGKPTHF